MHAEVAVLGSILLNPELMSGCYLQPEEMSEDRHRLIMEYLRYLSENDLPIDFVTMARQSGKDLERIGGMSYLVQLTESVPASINFNHYQKIVRDDYIQAQTVKVLEDIGGLSDAGASGKMEAAELIIAAQEQLERVAALGTGNEREFNSMFDVLGDHEKTIISRQNKRGMTGAKTASRDLNTLTGGHQDGDLIIIAARPSMGKTAYVVNDMKAAADGGRTAALFSLEMGAERIAERFLCAIGRIDNSKVRTGQFSDTDWEHWSIALDIMQNLPLLIDDTPGITLQEIDRKVGRLKKQHPNLIVYVDFLQLVNPGRTFKQPHEGIAFVSKGLKQIARKYSIPVVAISAVGRSVEQRQDKRPLMSDLRESGSIESDADVVIFLYRDDYYNRDSENKGIVELIVAKGRNVGTGTVEMAFIPKTGRFTDIDRDHQERGAANDQNGSGVRSGARADHKRRRQD